MKQPDSHRVRRSITRFRRLTLVSVAAIMVINFVMVQRITTVLDGGSAAKITESGSMRLLSQRIRSTAFEIDTAVRNERWERLEQLHADLASSTQKINTINQDLFAPARSDASSKYSTDELDLVAAIAVPFNRMSTASKELQVLTRNTIRRAPYLDKQTKDRISATMEEVRESQGQLLPRMQAIVELFENRSRSEINQSTTQARAGLLVLAAMLGAMVLFIIEPTILIVRKQLHELDRATRQARRADSVRWRLLTNMGHEFRTPMNAILGFTDLLNAQTLSDSERQRLTESIQDSAQNLAALIETMLNMSAIESGQLRINTTSSTIAQALEPSIQRAQISAQSVGLTLDTTLDESCNTAVLIDPRRLAQTVDKLVENAIKFTEEGTVSIDASLEQTPQSDRVIIRVSDTGIGIDDQEMQNIFDAFHQAQNTLTRKFGGSGLGLSFARNLARAMGGEITANSTPGSGSVFTVTLEAQLAPQDDQHNQDQQSPIADPSVALKDARVLIVDDAKDNRVLLEHVFKPTGATIEFALDGQQAIDTVLNARQEQSPFDIILMDMQMPILDGYSATSQLREVGIQTPIIALTAHALDGDRERCLEAGCDDYITKPVNRTVLLETCAKSIKKSSIDNTRQAA